MHYRIKITICLILIFAIHCNAQKYNNNWVFGNYAGINFNLNPPQKILTDSIVTSEGSTAISDPVTGQLIFYAMGDTVFNRNNQIMPNGIGLGGHISATQGALAVPDPGNNNKYYLFTVFAQANVYAPFCCGSGGLNLNVVDMTMNGGLGDVTIKNQLILSPTCEKLCAVKQCNNIDYWIVVHEWNSSKFYAYPLTAAGLGVPVISDIGIIHSDVGSASAYETIGYMRISPDGKKIALAASQQLNTVELFDFNNATGVVAPLIFSDSNYSNQCGSSGPYGICFSPDNSKLYTSMNVPGSSACVDTSGIYQYDLSLGNGAAILNSKTLVHADQNVQYAAMQIGPDGKIYVARSGSSKLDVIQNPDSIAALCNYTASSFSINTFSGNHNCVFGLPNFVESFLAHPLKCYLKFQGCLQPDSILMIDTFLTAPYTFSWNFGDPSSGVNNTSTDQNPNHTFSSIGIFNVSLSVNTPCGNIIIIRQINSKGSFAVDAGNDTLICLGENFTIQTTGGANFIWSPATGLSCTDCAQPIANPTLNTTYIVNVNAAPVGCTDADTIIINVADKAIAIANPDTTVCRGAIIQLQASGGNNYHWFSANGLSATDIANPIAQIDSAINYFVIVKLGSCIPDTGFISINIFNDAMIDAGADQQIYEGESAQITAISNGGQYAWLPSTGLSATNIFNPVATPETNATYTITLTDINGCTASDSIRIVVLADSSFVIVPNVFSPNGDGINDQLAYYTHNIESLNFKIYNRWGQLIFESNVAGQYWNGIYKRVPQNIGGYVYVVKAITRSGKTISQHGSFILIR